MSHAMRARHASTAKASSIAVHPLAAPSGGQRAAALRCSVLPDHRRASAPDQGLRLPPPHQTDAVHGHAVDSTRRDALHQAVPTPSTWRSPGRRAHARPCRRRAPSPLRFLWRRSHRQDDGAVVVQANGAALLPAAADKISPARRAVKFPGAPHRRRRRRRVGAEQGMAAVSCFAGFARSPSVATIDAQGAQLDMAWPAWPAPTAESATALSPAPATVGPASVRRRATSPRSRR